MTPHSHIRLLPPHGGRASLESECRGSKSACADLDGTKAGRVPRTAALREAS